MSAIEVLPVTTRPLHRAFCELPYQLYRSDPLWVPLLRSTEEERWSDRHNTSLRSRWYRRFVVQRAGRIVGRVAVSIDEEFCRRWLDAGFFGFFECTDDPEAAAILLSVGEEVLRQEGKTRILGPINLTTHDEVGLLVDGYDSPPMVLSPYNPPYYERLLLELGWEPRCDYHSYRWSPDQPHGPAVARLLRWRSRPGISLADLVVRPSRPRHWAEEMRTLRELYNESFASVWGSVPISPEEFAERADTFHSFYDPELVLFAEMRGRAVGFAIALPDVNEALARVGGRLWPFGWLRLLWGLRRIQRGRFLLLGVLPGATGAGVAALLAHEMAEAARRRGYKGAELSLVLDDNTRCSHVVEAFGGERCKTYRLYEKGIGR